MPALSAIVVVREKDLRQELSGLLARRGYQVLDSPRYEIDAALIECGTAAEDGGVLCARRVRAVNHDARILILAREGSEQLAVEALHLQAADYLKAPYDTRRIEAVLDGWPRPEPRDEPERRAPMIGESPAMRAVKCFVEDLSRTDSSVLITGETGAGKELVAERIHLLSRRRNRPFICLNCAAIPDTLIESELFGHERGAFTGATASRDGKLAQAAGGTVFFDEIGDLSPLAQAKILRAIETKELYRVGGQRKQILDIRVIAATNRDLEAMIKGGWFRADLYYRLNVARIHMPALRERPGDIAPLVEHFLPHFNALFGRRVEHIDPEAFKIMMSYSWPGNVRELRNTLEIVFLKLKRDRVTVEDLPPQLLGRNADGTGGERERLMSALLETHWNVSEAARKLHWSRMTMYRRLAKYNLMETRPPQRAKPKTAIAG